MTSLNRVETDCWQLLEVSCSDRSQPWRLPVLATVSEATCRQRTVVLRKVDAASRTVCFHTDIRSAKIQQLRHNSLASLLFYDSTTQSQLQLSGTTTIHTDDDVAQNLWEQESPMSLRSFLSALPPGTPITEADFRFDASGLPDAPTVEDVQPGRANFCVVCCHVAAMEWLMLRPEGHLRARFEYDTSQTTTRQWLSP
jgi:hypothetical protein